MRRCAPSSSISHRTDDLATRIRSERGLLRSRRAHPARTPLQTDGGHELSRRMVGTRLSCVCQIGSVPLAGPDTCAFWCRRKHWPRSVREGRVRGYRVRSLLRCLSLARLAAANPAPRAFAGDRYLSEAGGTRATGLVPSLWWGPFDDIVGERCLAALCGGSGRPWPATRRSLQALDCLVSRRSHCRQADGSGCRGDDRGK